MSYKLSILICSLDKRKALLTRLLSDLLNQVEHYDNIEILIEVDNGELTIGEKRQRLLDRANGQYLCFIDDDDLVSSDYIEKTITALENNPDCLSLTGMLYHHGRRVKPFIHSIRYTEYSEDNKAYYRPPNHLNVVRTEIARKYGFPKLDHGEDTDYAMRMCRGEDLKRETEIEGVIYHYYFDK